MGLWEWMSSGMAVQFRLLDGMDGWMMGICH